MIPFFWYIYNNWSMEIVLTEHSKLANPLLFGDVETTGG